VLKNATFEYLALDVLLFIQGTTHYNFLSCRLSSYVIHNNG